MAIVDKTTLKAFFETGDVPTEAQFIDFIDSFQDISTYKGDFASDTLAGAGGVVLGEAYMLSAGNIYGIPSPDNGTLKVRKV